MAWSNILNAVNKTKEKADPCQGMARAIFSNKYDMQRSLIEKMIVL